jgi:hypothetical protein
MGSIKLRKNNHFYSFLVMCVPVTTNLKDKGTGALSRGKL